MKLKTQEGNVYYKTEELHPKISNLQLCSNLESTREHLKMGGEIAWKLFTVQRL
jgi:hypothetical protein